MAVAMIAACVLTVHVGSSAMSKFLMYLAGPIVAGVSWQFIRENVGVPLSIDNARIKRELSIEFRPLETSKCAPKIACTAVRLLTHFIQRCKT
jgi:hypothetical protein